MAEDTENITKIRAADALRELLNPKKIFKSIPDDLDNCLQCSLSHWGRKKTNLYPSLNCKCCIVCDKSIFNRN